MGRDEEVPYKQDRLGNERRELDELRARDGSYGADSDDRGIETIASDETGSSQTLYSIPTNVDKVHLTQIQAFNSAPSGDNTFSIYELDLDSNGAVTASTRRSVPIVVDSASTRFESYEGLEFNKAIGVQADFEGTVAVGVKVDQEQYKEPNSENY